MFEFLKSERFNVIFSFLIGISLVLVFKPKCKDDCRTAKAPPVEEVKASTYQIGPKCWQFSTELVACPSGGAGGQTVVEPFERSA